MDDTKEYFGPLINRHASVAMSHVAAHFDGNTGNGYHVRSMFAMSRFFGQMCFYLISVYTFMFFAKVLNTSSERKNFLTNEMIFSFLN